MMQLNPATSVSIRPDQIQFLQQQGFSSGLIQVVAYTIQRSIAERWWLMDNSASMATRDAHLVGQTGTGASSSLSMNVTQPNEPTSRWEEMRSTAIYHAHMAAFFQAPAQFTLLNRTDPYSPYSFPVAKPTGIGSGDQAQQQVHFMEHALKSSFPVGGTPLTHHLIQMRQAIVPIASQLRAAQQRIAIILATDGLPSTEHNEHDYRLDEFVHVVRSFQDLPVHMVVRLCTDNERVFEFYNSLDTHLPYDVLDDYIGEAAEVYLHNPWLTYCLCLHRLREMGCPSPTLDALDERILSHAELQALCRLLFATTTPFPDPATQWSAFVHVLSQCLQQERMQWNPITKVYMPWIDLTRLHATYGPNPKIPMIQSPTKSAMHYSMPSSVTASSPPFQFSLGSVPTVASVPNPVSASMPLNRSVPNTQPLPTSFPVGMSPHGASQYAAYGHSGMAVSPPPFMPGMASTTATPVRPQPQSSCPSGQQSFHPQQQQQQQPSPFVGQGSGASNRITTQAQGSEDVIKAIVLQSWALQPPHLQHLHPIPHLLLTLPHILPPTNTSVPKHAYFDKFQPFSPDAFTSTKDTVIIKRAIRKVKFFLHPDKLPKDFVPAQRSLCQTLWDVIADAWDTYSNST